MTVFQGSIATWQWTTKSNAKWSASVNTWRPEYLFILLLQILWVLITDNVTNQPYQLPPFPEEHREDLTKFSCFRRKKNRCIGTSQGGKFVGGCLHEWSQGSVGDVENVHYFVEKYQPQKLTENLAAFLFNESLLTIFEAF